MKDPNVICEVCWKLSALRKCQTCTFFRVDEKDGTIGVCVYRIISHSTELTPMVTYSHMTCDFHKARRCRDHGGT